MAWWQPTRVTAKFIRNAALVRYTSHKLGCYAGRTKLIRDATDKFIPTISYRTLPGIKPNNSRRLRNATLVRYTSHKLDCYAGWLSSNVLRVGRKHSAIPKENRSFWSITSFAGYHYYNICFFVLMGKKFGIVAVSYVIVWYRFLYRFWYLSSRRIVFQMLASPGL